MAMASDGEIIAAADNTGTTILWDTATGREIHRREAKSEHPSIAFAPDGKSYAASDNRGARLWDTASGRELHRFSTPAAAARLLCFAPDGKTLAFASGEAAWLCDVMTGRRKRDLHGVDYLHSMAFAHDGKILATGDYCGRIRLWNVATGLEIRQFGDQPQVAGEGLYVKSLAFLPDDKMIVVATVAEGSSPFSLQIWDIATGKVRRRLEGHINVVDAITIAPDGKTMATASADGTTLVWDVSKIGE